MSKKLPQIENFMYRNDLKGKEVVDNIKISHPPPKAAVVVLREIHRGK